MGPTSSLVWFVVTAVLTNVVIYGGIATAYFTYKRRNERALAAVRSQDSSARSLVRSGS